MTDTKNFDFDRLKMYFGEPYKITSETGDVEILQPTIGDILYFGEREFYSMLNVFVSNTTSYRLQLWDMGVDWNKISDYELFCMLIKSLDVTATKLLLLLVGMPGQVHICCVYTTYVGVSVSEQECEIRVCESVCIQKGVRGAVDS